MPLPAYSPYQEATGAVNNLGNSLNDVLIGLVQHKMQQQRMGEQILLRRAEFGLAKQREAREKLASEYHNRLSVSQAAASDAQRAYDEARTTGLTAESDIGAKLGEIMRELANPEPGLSPPPQILRGIAAQRAAELAARGRSQIPENVAQLMFVNDPGFMRALALGGVDKTYHVTPQGATSTSPWGPAVTGGVTLGPGQQRFAPGTDIDLETLISSMQAAPATPVASVPPRPGGLTSADQERRSLGNILSSMLTAYRGAPDIGTPEEEDQARLFNEIVSRLRRSMTNAPTGLPERPMRADLLPSTPTLANPPAAIMGTLESPHKPQTKIDFDLIPSGAYFINPSDGKLMQKN